jgi:hypothetical protein
MPWFWTDDLARLLTGEGQPDCPTFERWIRQPQAVRGEGDSATIALRLLAEESDEPSLAA